MTCRIWGEDHEASGRTHPDPSYAIVNSPRTGGKYKITGDARPYIPGLSDKEKAKLTTWLIDQRMQGIEIPEVTAAVVQRVKTMHSLPVYERADRLLRFIASEAKTVAATVAIQEESSSAYAWSESIDWDEVVYFLDYIYQMGWIQGQRSGEGWFYGGPTVVGHSRIANQQASVDSSQAFIAMWFDDSMTACRDGIELGIGDAGYKPFRIDQKEHINKIDDEIIAEIRRSRFLVADFTHGEDGARGGVYYEAGFAHGLGIPVIFTCRQDAVCTLHFDTNHYNHIVWANPEELREKLKNRILAVIGEGSGGVRIDGRI